MVKCLNIRKNIGQPIYRSISNLNGWGYTHSMCCLFGREACIVSARDVLPLRTLWSRQTFFREDAQARVPHGSGPAVAETQRRLQSWGSQRDLSAEVEKGTAFSLPSPNRFSASSQGWEACAAVSSAPIGHRHCSYLILSFNAKDTEDSPPQSHAYEELRLWQEQLRDWISIGQQRGFVQKADLTNASHLLAHNLNAGDCLTEVWRSWEKTVSYWVLIES